MIKTKKPIALMIAVLMLMSNFIGLLGNISIAVSQNVTVEISVENDDSAHLSDDGKTLNYQCEDGSSYDFQLVKDGEAIVLTKNDDPTNGDKYVATGISSNENLKLYSPRLHLGVLQVFYSGSSMGMVPEHEQDGDATDYYSQPLVDLDDVSNYQFRLQETHNQGGNQVDPQAMADLDYTVDFGTSTWTIGEGEQEETTTAVVPETDLTHGAVIIKGNQDIELLDWNPSTMQVLVEVTDPEGHVFGTHLGVREEEGHYYTRIMDAQNNLSNSSTVYFSVQEFHEEFHGGPDMSETTYSVDFGEASWEVRNKTTEASVTIDEQNIDLTHGRVDICGDQIINLSNWDSKLMQARIIIVDPKMDPEEIFDTRLHVSDSGETRIMDIEADNIPWGDEGMYIRFLVERYTGELPENNLPAANDSAEVTLRGVDSGNPDTQERVSYRNARVAINGFPIILDDPNSNINILNETENSTTIGDFGYFYDANENEGKVRITFSAIFDTKYIGSVFVNGQEFVIYDPNRAPEENLIDYSNGTDWLMHYNQQEVGFDVFVDKADSYDIGVELAKMNGDYIAIGNFLWTDSPENFDKDDYVGNATLELLQVTYDIDLNCDGDYTDDGEQVTVYFDENGDFDDPYDIIEYAPYGEVGSLVVPAFSECLMKITPDYGYQVLAFGGNGEDFLTGNISEFTFFAHKGNFHLGAHVVPVDDVVNATSEKVKSGNITIGENEINSGTVVLSVDDANPTEEKTQGFENAAGDYEIDSYLDISLDQVLYKGNAENVWSNELHELNQDATIELELDEDLSNKNILVLHNVGDGDDFEVIEIDGYDPETNTLTFTTDSFSGYAIAVKDKPVEDDSTDPENPTDPTDPTDPEEPSDPEEPAPAQEKYTVTEGDFTVVFSDDAGHEFELEVFELLNLTPEELAAMDITEEEYEQAVAEITEALKKYGTIINVYEINVFDGQFDHFGEVTIKIKMSDEMKKYNSFKFICVDDDEITDKDVVTLEDKDGYLTGNLFHLSSYALVGSNAQDEATETTTDGAATTTNPKTGDNIMFYVVMFVISLAGTIVTVKNKK